MSVISRIYNINAGYHHLSEEFVFLIFKGTVKQSYRAMGAFVGDYVETAFYKDLGRETEKFIVTDNKIALLKTKDVENCLCYVNDVVVLFNKSLGELFFLSEIDKFDNDYSFVLLSQSH